MWRIGNGIIWSAKDNFIDENKNGNCARKWRRETGMALGSLDKMECDEEGGWSMERRVGTWKHKGSRQ
jgi:hypothetical protein